MTLKCFDNSIHIDRAEYPGKSKDSKDKALVVAGVHGSELSGIEVVQILMNILSGGSKPYFHTTIIPILFYDNYLKAKQSLQTYLKNKISLDDLEIDSNQGRDTNGRSGLTARNFPNPGDSLTTALNNGIKEKKFCNIQKGKTIGKKAQQGWPVDSQCRTMEYENIFLVELIGKLKPIRIASVHAHSLRRLPSIKDKGAKDKDLPGIFVDPIINTGGGSKLQKRCQTRKPNLPKKPPSGAPTPEDKLVLKMAKFVRSEQDKYEQKNLSMIFGKILKVINQVRSGLVQPSKDDWVIGNWLDISGREETRYPRTYAEDDGISLGGWAPHKIQDYDRITKAPLSENRSGATLITVEVRHYYPTEAFMYIDTKKYTPLQNQELREKYNKRVAELTAHANALRHIFLEDPL